MSSGREPGERFAAAWEARAADRGPTDAGPTDPSGAGPSPTGPSPTPGDSADPSLVRDLRIAARLQQAGRDTPGPDPEARRRMRAHVMAAAAAASDDTTTTGTTSGTATGTRVVATPPARRSPRSGAPAGAGTRPGAGGRRPRRDRARPVEPPLSRRARLLVRATTAFCAVLAAGVLAVAFSRGAIPGDALYGVKQVSESAELGLTSGQEAKARKHLDFAALRLQEVSALVARDGDSLDPAQRSLADGTLRAFSDQAEQGAALIRPLAGRPGTPPADALAGWARAQNARLDAVAPSIGPVAALDRSRAVMDSIGGDTPAPPQCPSGGDPVAGTCAPTPAPAAPETTGVEAPPAPAAGADPPATTTTAPTPTPTTTTPAPTRTGAPAVPAAPSGGGLGSGPGPAISVPAPVPGLPRVELPPLIPGLPGIRVG